MFCPKCGAELPSNALFCGKCGVAVNTVPEADPAPELPLTEEPATVYAPELPLEPPAEPTPILPVEPIPEPIPVIPTQPEAPPAAPSIEDILSAPLYTAPDPVSPAAQPAAAPVQSIPTPSSAPAKAPKVRKARRKPHILLRVPMQLLSLVLCLVLFVSMLVTVVLADLNRITSAGGIQQIITAALSPASAPVRPVPGAMGMPGLSVQKDDADTNSLIDWIYEQAEAQSGQKLPIEKDDLGEFLEKSTLDTYLAEKLAGYADDFINGTEDTLITTEEIMDILAENEDLIEDAFDIRVTQEIRDQFENTVKQVVETNDLNGKIREEVFVKVEEALSNSLNDTLGMDMDQLRFAMQQITSDTVLLTAIGICLALMLLICALNFYNIPAGMTWIAIPGIIMGIIVSLPIAALQMMPGLIGDLFPGAGMVAQLIGSFVGALAPIHYGLLIFSFAMLVGSIVWRVVRSRKNKSRAAIAL